MRHGNSEHSYVKLALIDEQRLHNVLLQDEVGVPTGRRDLFLNVVFDLLKVFEDPNSVALVGCLGRLVDPELVCFFPELIFIKVLIMSIVFEVRR